VVEMANEKWPEGPFVKYMQRSGQRWPADIGLRLELIRYEIEGLNRRKSSVAGVRSEFDKLMPGELSPDVAEELQREIDEWQRGIDEPTPGELLANSLEELRLQAGELPADVAEGIQREIDELKVGKDVDTRAIAYVSRAQLTIRFLIEYFDLTWEPESFGVALWCAAAIGLIELPGPGSGRRWGSRVPEAQEVSLEAVRKRGVRQRRFNRDLVHKVDQIDQRDAQLESSFDDAGAELLGNLTKRAWFGSATPEDEMKLEHPGGDREAGQ
jgi:hypothetical protein